MQPGSSSAALPCIDLLQIRSLHLQLRAAERKASTAQRQRSSVERAATLQGSASNTDRRESSGGCLGERDAPKGSSTHDPQAEDERVQATPSCASLKLEDATLAACTAHLAVLAEESDLQVL